MVSVPGGSAELIESQADHFSHLLDLLDHQTQVREETFSRAMSKTTTEQDRLRSEVAMLEAYLSRLPPRPPHAEVPVLPRVASSGTIKKSNQNVLKPSVRSRSSSSSSSSQVNDLMDLKDTLKRQMAELQQLATLRHTHAEMATIGTQSSAVPHLRVSSTVSSDSEFDPLAALVFKRHR